MKSFNDLNIYSKERESNCNLFQQQKLHLFHEENIIKTKQKLFLHLEQMFSCTGSTKVKKEEIFETLGFSLVTNRQLKA